MRTLTVTSVVSMLCAASVWLYAAPQLVFRGMVDLGPLVGVMVMLPTVVGLIAALVGVFAGGIELARRRPGLMGCTVWMILGQVVTWGIAIAVIVWAAAFGSTGWELLALPVSLMLGQLLVAVGLVLRRRGGLAQGRSPAVEQI